MLITFAAHIFVGIPCRVVLGANVFDRVRVARGRAKLLGDKVVVRVVREVVGKISLALAGTVAAAAVGADTAAASFTLETRLAIAHAGLAVTSSLAGAFDALLVVVVALGSGSPYIAIRACPQRAVSTGPGSNIRVAGSEILGLAACEARAGVLGVVTASAVAAAAVRAEGCRRGEQACEDEELHRASRGG